MNRMRLIVLGWVSCLLSACLAEPTLSDPPVWMPEEPSRCELRGWVASRDVVTVRSQPSPDADAVGTLPAMVKTPDFFHYGVELSILSAQNGWLKIADARDDPVLSGQPARPTYSGTGWVPGSAVSFSVQSDTGYARPDTTSTTLATLEDGWLTEVGAIDRIVACTGEWALLDYRLVRERNDTTDILEELTPEQQAATQSRAWFRGICPLQETTCDQE